MESSFQVSTHQSDCCKVIELIGDLDLASAPTLGAVLDQMTAQPDHLILDVSRLSFIDSTGLGLLMAASRLVGGRIWLKECSPQLRRLLALTSVTDLFCLEEDEELAHQIISAAAR